MSVDTTVAVNHKNQTEPELIKVKVADWDAGVDGITIDRENGDQIFYPWHRVEYILHEKVEEL